MATLAIIPARSGSKGLKDKNIKELDGKPLIAYSITAAFDSQVIDCVHVSTDSEYYANISREYGADIPFLRPDSLSSDTATTWDAVKFVINKYQELGKMFDTVILLQPTSPLRTKDDIRRAYEIYQKNGADSVMSVCEMEHSPLWSNVLPEDGSLHGFIKPENDKRRQELPTYYRLNGAIYIQDVNLILSDGDFYGTKSYAYIMNTERSIDIDNEIDFIIADTILRNKIW